jgi:tetratricopeptide (TPR) repeat protein
MRTRNKKSLKKENRLPTYIICVLLAGVVWIAFGQTLRHDFVNYDDNDYVYENPRIIPGLSVSGIKWAFTHVHAANWHPLTTISHMLDVQLYGLQPWGHHLTNVILQATAAILLFLALRKLTLSIWPSAFVAALFAIHPLRVESVAWISERKDLLSGVFFMLTLLAYARYVRSDRDRSSPYAMVVALFALGLMCKPTLVTLPFVLLLLDYWPLRRWQGAGSTELGAKGKGQNRKREAGKAGETSLRGLLVEKIPLFALSTASCVVTLLAQHEVLQKTLNITFIERAANAVVSYATYLGQMFYPAHLAVLYPYSKADLKIAGVILDLGLLFAISVICFLWRRKYPFLTIGWLWYLGMLVPMIGIVQVGLQTHGDRYTYLPQIGLYIAVAWGAVELFKKWRVRPEIATIAASIAVIALTACTYREASFWQNGETLWKHAIENGSNSSVAHYSLGTLFLRQGQLDAALTEFEKALQINPNNAEAEMNSGVALLQKGDLDGAINHTQKALQIDPDYFEAEYNLGNLLQQRGQPDEAIPHYRKALVSKPSYPEAHNSLGVALAQKGELDAAIAEFEEALRLKPDYPEAHSDLGNALASQHKFDQAIPQHLEALRLKPNSPQARYNLGYTLLQAGRRDEAIAQFGEALRLNSNYTEARNRLRELGMAGSP